MHEQRSAVSQGGVREPLLIAGGQPIPTALAMIFAGAADGIPVLLADPAGPTPTPDAVPDGTFLIVVTSGTSGRPRPVLRTAESWTASFAPLTELAGLSPDDRVLLTGPLHATLHLFAAVHTLAMGAELTQWPERATAVHAVPAVLSDLITTLPATAPLRTAVVAGSTLTTEIGDRALARGITVTEYYGAAELSFVAARRYPAPLRPFPGAEVDIRPAVTATERGDCTAVPERPAPPARCGSARPTWPSGIRPGSTVRCVATTTVTRPSATWRTGTTTAG